MSLTLFSDQTAQRLVLDSTASSTNLRAHLIDSR